MRRNTSRNHPCAMGSIGVPSMEQIAKLAGHAPPKPDTETQILKLLVQLTGVVDTVLERIIKLEGKVAHQAKILDRLREFAPDVGVERI